MPSNRPRQQEKTTSRPPERESQQRPPQAPADQSPIKQDDRLIGIDRLPRKGDDEE
jgi:hypothetical protein